MEKHLHIKIDSVVKAEAKAYALHAPMSLGQMVEKALLEYMASHKPERHYRDTY